MVDVGGSRIWVTSSGAGPAMVLCAGGPGCCDYLEPVASMFDDLGEVFRFEQRGCGRSEPCPPYDYETCLQDLEALRCEVGAERWVVGGHSWGANLALGYALEHPQRVTGVLYLAGNGLQNDRSWSVAYHKELESRGEREPDYQIPPNADVNREVNASWRLFIQQPSLWRRIADLNVPTLVVVCDRDVRPSWPAEQLARLLPDARLERIGAAEHCPWIDDPESEAALRAAIRRFLGSLG